MGKLGVEVVLRSREKNSASEPTHPAKTCTREKTAAVVVAAAVAAKRRKENNKPEWLESYEVFIKQKSKQFQ